METLKPSKNKSSGVNASEEVYEFSTVKNNLLEHVAEVNHSNIEDMMNSLVVNVLENFDSKLPSLLDEVSQTGLPTNAILAFFLFWIKLIIDYGSFGSPNLSLPPSEVSLSFTCVFHQSPNTRNILVDSLLGSDLRRLTKKVGFWAFLVTANSQRNRRRWGYGRQWNRCDGEQPRGWRKRAWL